MLCLVLNLKISDFLIPALTNNTRNVGNKQKMTKEKIFESYNEINLGQNKICLKCIESNKASFFSKPISIWKVGKNMNQNQIKYCL